MNKLRYISPKNLPPSLPILTTAVVYLLLDKFNASQLVWGIVITLLVIYWLSVLFAVITADLVDVLPKEEKN